MRLRFIFLVIGLVVFMPIFASAVEHFVSIPGFSFSPQNLTIAEGDMVTWTNDHNINHTSTSADAGATWDSGTLAPTESFSFTFNTSGSYDYLCSFHPSMTGNITVEPNEVPTLSEWGMIILGLLLMAGGTVALIRRQRTVAAS